MTRTLVALAVIGSTLAHTAPAFAFNQAETLASSVVSVSGTDLGSGRVTPVSEASLGSGR